MTTPAKADDAKRIPTAAESLIFTKNTNEVSRIAVVSSLRLDL